MSLVALVQGPHLGPRLCVIDPPILGEARQLGPGLPGGAVIGDLEDRMLQGLLGELNPEGPVQALHAGVGGEDDRHQLLEPAPLPGGVKGPRPAHQEQPAPQLPAEARQDFLLGRREVGGAKIGEHDNPERGQLLYRGRKPVQQFARPLDVLAEDGLLRGADQPGDLDCLVVAQRQVDELVVPRQRALNVKHAQFAFIRDAHRRAGQADSRISSRAGWAAAIAPCKCAGRVCLR